MAKTWPVLALALLAVALAILLAPAAHGLLRDLGAGGEDLFAKTFRRLLLVLLLIVLFGCLRPWRDGGPASYGLRGPRARIGPGLSAGGLTLLVCLGFLLWYAAAGWLAWEQPLDGARALRRALRWLLVAPLIAVVEEWFFRGWLDRRFGRLLSPGRTALAVAAIYAVVHAFKPSRLAHAPTHDAAGAAGALLGWLGGLLDLETFAPAFVGLFLVSLVLTALWRRTGTLWTGVLVHAAAVFVIRTYGGFTDHVYAHRPSPLLVGSKELHDGLPAWGILLACLWVLRPRGGEAAGRSAAPPGRPGL